MSNPSFGVLLVGDEPKCLRLLRKQPFEVVCADRLVDGLAQLKARRVDLVLMALSLPDGQGTEAFVKIHEAEPHLPIIVLATRAEEKLAASLMPLGAQDYLLVPELTGPMLARAIHNANERHLIQEEHSRAGHLLQGLMDNIPDSIYFKDTASRCGLFQTSSRATGTSRGTTHHADRPAAGGRRRKGDLAGWPGDLGVLDENVVARPGGAGLRHVWHFPGHHGTPADGAGAGRAHGRALEGTPPAAHAD
jgi:CheY-like chemotaxis protein